MSLPRYASRGPTRFLLHYLRRRVLSHSVVLIAVLGAVGCSVASQYGLKAPVDVLGVHNPKSSWPPRSTTSTEEAATAAAKKLHRLDRGRIRSEFDRRFTARHMAENYVQVYQELRR